MKVTFPDRHTGLVRVEDALLLRTGQPWIEISFRREDVARVLAGASDHPFAANRLLEALAESSFQRLMIQTLLDDPRSQLLLHGVANSLLYSIAISREDLALAVGDPRGLRFQLSMLLGEPVLVKGLQAEYRPRGATARAGPLLLPVRPALIEALRLAVQAASDTEIRAAIHNQLGSVFTDYRLTGDHRHRHNAMAARSNALRLVERAFRGWWEKYGVKSPAARLDDGEAPRDAYRALLSTAERRHGLTVFRAMPEDMQATAHRQWQHRLLVEGAGAAAREWKLL